MPGAPTQRPRARRNAAACVAGVLHGGQHYLIEGAAALGHVAHLRWHPIATSTCSEKAQLLGWPLERVVKALYFFDGARWVGVVTPELSRRIDAAPLVAEVLGISRRQARRFHLGRCPAGMEPGTCTPFPRSDALEGPGPRIERIVVHDHAPIRHQLVDVSIGGRGPRAHRLSCQLVYPAVFEILERRFGSRVVLRRLDGHLEEASGAVAAAGDV